MIDHDKHVGELLALLDALGIAENTFVFYSTDNGPHLNSWPDAGMTPFRNEKNSNWEGAYRVPAIVRWPGRSRPAGLNESLAIWTGCHAAIGGRVPDIAEKLREGMDLGDTTYKLHLDGYDLLAYMTGQIDESPREILLFL